MWDALAGLGGRFVLCDHEKRPAADVYRDNRIGWLSSRPTAADVRAHLASGRPVGVEPYTLGATVFDVDSGSWGDVVQALDPYTPIAVIPSQRAGRAHLWYRDSHPRRQKNWALLHGRIFVGTGEEPPPGSLASGQVKAYHSYVVLWSPDLLHSAIEALRPRRFRRLRPDLFALAHVEVAHADPGPALIEERPAPAPAKPLVLDGARKPLEQQTEPGRERAHFLELADWAYRAVGAAGNKRVWFADVRRRAWLLWAKMPEPRIAGAEVDSTSRSVARYCWENRTTLSRRYSARQRARQKLQVKARRTANAERDDEWREMVAAGLSVRAVAQLSGVFPSVVSRAIRQEPIPRQGELLL